MIPRVAPTIAATTPAPIAVVVRNLGVSAGGFSPLLADDWDTFRIVVRVSAGGFSPLLADD